MITKIRFDIKLKTAILREQKKIRQSMDNKQGKAKTSHITGNITVTRRGVGYVPNEAFEEDIEIPNDYINTALNKDEVEIMLHPKVEGKRLQGEVIKIIERAKTQFVGTVEKQDGLSFLDPDDQRMYMDILLSPEEKAEDGMKVLVELTHWDNPKKNPEGKILQVLGRKGEHNVEMQSIVLSHGFETGFPEEVEKSAKVIGDKKEDTFKEEAQKRKDFRGITTMTIDPPDAKDFDDALSIKTLGNGNLEIGIHIADVSHYIKPGDAIDKEAQKRATSIYLVDRTIPMLPEVLSNDVCSLRPEEDRLAYSAVLEMSKEGEVKSHWFGKTIIRSDKRFSYEDAQKTIDAKSGEYYEELKTLDEVAKIIRKERFKKGSVAFEHDEVRFTLDENGKPTGVERKIMYDTNHLIEEYMLLANKEVAQYINKLNKKGLLFVYRIHDVPDPEKIQDLKIFVNAIGYDFNPKEGGVTTHDINNLFKQIEGKPVEDLIKISAIRSMSKAVYSTKNIGHFGLAFKYYTHFTSPIRRYPDLMVHRIMKSQLTGDEIPKEELSKYEKLTLTSTEQEIEATQAERDSIRYKQIEYMKEHIGEVFDGKITGVAEFGIFVEDVNTKSEGLVHVSKIGDDFYTLDKKTYSIKGERGGKSFTLGDKVKIKLLDADLDKKTLDFVIV
ncbi:MAG: ribonuclease R [Candidatus Pacebacteria bacterium]|jgi:ribonuclease R|nr:ribonuclease R [Parcubacteria group bacterium]MDP6249267.1 ribonuclease R [Candidatus Paceibacterota bacterium]MDP7159502.1 ribonuclease R [Candidatus Paceibacterota bacterium]MDP7367355.1 ribonuclease R [Candidatus Paceibacterota bacterium]MDP7466125.1 ribonuclease R [Candidatus Paceibacterota bacterium]|tara:strand:+ start:581 stop:2584 length:2004 start_codon:yes stop_codon:yes gene_type:complete